MSNQLEYYLSIESDLEDCARYVEFSQENFETYSIEFSRIIMAASAEIDTTAKELCSLINSNETTKNIRQYANCIHPKYPNIPGVVIAIPRYGLKTKPWEDWSNIRSPDWWHGYNALKHDRVNEFKKANLKNALNAVAGLLSITLYFHKEKEGKLLEINALRGPRLLAIENNTENDDWVGGGIFWEYSLP